MIVVPLGGPAVFEIPPPEGRVSGGGYTRSGARTINPAGRIVGVGGGGG